MSPSDHQITVWQRKTAQGWTQGHCEHRAPVHSERAELRQAAPLHGRECQRCVLVLGCTGRLQALREGPPGEEESAGMAGRLVRMWAGTRRAGWAGRRTETQA